MTLERPMFPPRAESSNVVKFPYSVSRRAHSRRPRRSKNGSPEQRAAAAAAALPPPADVVSLSICPDASEFPSVDRRKLRGSPLREKIAPISFAVTIVGKMHTAELRLEPIDLDAASSEGWVSQLQAGADAAKFAACELEKAAAHLQQLARSEFSDFPINLPVSDLGQSVLNQIADGDR